MALVVLVVVLFVVSCSAAPGGADPGPEGSGGGPVGGGLGVPAVRAGDQGEGWRVGGAGVVAGRGVVVVGLTVVVAGRGVVVIGLTVVVAGRGFVVG